MANQGWVRLHRKIFTSDVWTDEPYTERELWIHLFAMANHKDNYTDWYGERVLVHRGQHLTSVLKLGEITHRDRKWVERKLKNFVKMDMIKVEKCPNRFTLITVCNYDVYNPPIGHDATTDATTDTTTNAPQTTMTKNVNNNYSGKPEKVKRIKRGSPEYKRKIDLIKSTVKDELGCECSGGQAGAILRDAGGGKDR